MVVEIEQEAVPSSLLSRAPLTPELSLEDRSLVDGLKRGQREAWAQLYDRFAERVWRLAARMLGSEPQWVADVVQETFLAAVRSAGQFDAERGSLWSWLAVIAHRQAALSWRKHGQDQRLREVLVGLPREVLYGARVFDDSAPTDEWFERRELSLLIRATLSALPDDYATVLVAKYLDEQAIEDIALELGESYEAVRSRLARARREFKTTFERLTGEG